MIYKNVSNKARIAIVRMNKRIVRPGETIYMNPRDIDRTKSNMIHFAQVKGTDKVKQSMVKKPEAQKPQKKNPLAEDLSQYETPPQETVKDSITETEELHTDSAEEVKEESENDLEDSKVETSESTVE